MDIQAQVMQPLPAAVLSNARGSNDIDLIQRQYEFPAAQVISSASDQFGVPGFDDPGPVADYSGIAASFDENARLDVPPDPQKMSFSSETPALAQPSAQIDPVAINTLAEDKSLLDTSTYDQAQRNLSQASTVSQFKADVAEASTANLEENYFQNFGILKASEAQGDNILSGPAYLTGSSDVLYAGTDKPYTGNTPEEQAKAAGTAPSENQIPLMLGAYQHPNFANADPAIKNINVSALNDKLVDEATALLSQGTPLLSTSAPQPKLFQIGLKVNPEAYWQRPHLATNKKYYVQQPDGRIGYDPEVKIPLPDPGQTFSQPYQPYAQDKTIADLNQKLKMPDLNYDVVGTKTATGAKAQTMQEYNPFYPPPVGLRGQDLLFDENGAKQYNNSSETGDVVSAYDASANPATIASFF